MNRRTSRLARMSFAVLLCGAFTASVIDGAALAKPPRPQPARPQPERPAPAPKRPPVRDGGAPTDAGAPTREDTRTSSDAAVVETKTGDGGKSFRFEALEVEGRLKSPQIVYFLRRVRAEFAAGDLGHRSFSHELSETRDEPSF